MSNLLFEIEFYSELNFRPFNIESFSSMKVDMTSERERILLSLRDEIVNWLFS